MTVWVIRDGKLVEKGFRPGDEVIFRSDFPTPSVSRLDPYESPVTGAEITSWRARDADMKAADAYDPRDLPKDHVYSKGRKNG